VQPGDVSGSGKVTWSGCGDRVQALLARARSAVRRRRRFQLDHRDGQPAVAQRLRGHRPA